MPCRKARRALQNLMFEERRNTGTSHTQWEKVVGGSKFKATLACHNGEVKRDDIKSIIGQAGVTKAEFYAASESNKKGHPASHLRLMIGAKLPTGPITEEEE